MAAACSAAEYCVGACHVGAEWGAAVAASAGAACCATAMVASRAACLVSFRASLVRYLLD